MRATQLFESVLLQSDSPDDLQVLDARALQARTAGQYSLAISLAEEMVAQRRASDDRGRLSGGLRWSLFLLALMRREQGDLEGASVLFETMVQLHRGIGDREGIAIGLLGLSDISRDRGDTQQLRTYGGQSLLILRQLGVQWAIGFALNNLALAALWSGDLTGAAALIDEAVALFREQQAEGSLAEVLITQGQIYYAQGDGLTAQAVLREALGLALSVGPRLFVAGALEVLAEVAPAPDQAHLVVQLLTGAAALRKQLGTPIRPANQDAVGRLLAGARQLLGAEGFAASWAAGAAMPLDQALGMLPDSGTGPTSLRV